MRCASSSARPGCRPRERFHVQHFHELVAWGEIGLYAGTIDPRADLEARFAHLHGSLLTRISSIRLADEYLRGRLSLAGHRAADEAPRAARRLSREKNAMANVWGAVLTAGIAAEQSKTRAADLFARAGDAAERAGLRSTEAVARWRAATLRADEAGLAKAERLLVSVGVRDFERTCTLLAPMRVR